MQNSEEQVLRESELTDAAVTCPHCGAIVCLGHPCPRCGKIS